MIDRIRAIHERVTGTAPDGRPYAASDPHLLRWVHLAEVDSFLRAHQRYGARPLDEAGRDGYVADTARVAARARRARPADAPRPSCRAGLAEYRPELQGTAEARDAARFMLLQPPLPLPARAPYAVLAAAAVASCRAGPAGRCGCPTCRWPRPPWSGWPATAWCAASAGR